MLYADLGGYGPDGPVMTASAALCAFLDALGVAPDRLPGNRAAQAGLYRSLLHGRRMLILLDTASRVKDVRTLLPGTGGSIVIVTSRNQLTGLIATHDARPVTLEPLSAEDSRSMLASRLDPFRAAAEPEAMREITELCAGLPLALAVVAARATACRARTLAAAASELRDPGTRLCLLSTGDAAADLPAAFSASYRQLSLPARRLFRRLALHHHAVFMTCGRCHTRSRNGAPCSRKRSSSW